MPQKLHKAHRDDPHSAHEVPPTRVRLPHSREDSGPEPDSQSAVEQAVEQHEPERFTKSGRHRLEDIKKAATERSTGRPIVQREAGGRSATPRSPRSKRA
jgi:hypothetical protein